MNEEGEWVGVGGGGGKGGAPIRVNDFTHFSVDKIVEGVDMLPHQPAHLTLVSHATK